jgi:hypothetical protein
MTTASTVLIDRTLLRPVAPRQASSTGGSSRPPGGCSPRSDCGRSVACRQAVALKGEKTVPVEPRGRLGLGEDLPSRNKTSNTLFPIYIYIIGTTFSVDRPGRVNAWPAGGPPCSRSFQLAGLSNGPQGSWARSSVEPASVARGNQIRAFIPFFSSFVLDQTCSGA